MPGPRIKIALIVLDVANAPEVVARYEVAIIVSERSGKDAGVQTEAEVDSVAVKPAVAEYDCDYGFNQQVSSRFM